MTFNLTCDHIMSSSVWFAEWPPFGKKLLTLLTTRSHCSLTVFEGWILVLIASVPDLLHVFFFFSKLTLVNP